MATWAGVVLISFSGVYVRLADVEAARSAFLRNLYALPVLAVLVWVVRRRRDTATVSTPLLPVAVIAGLLLGIDLVFYHLGIGIVGAGLGTVLPNLQVVFVGIAGVLVFGERPARGYWIALPVVLGGVWMLGVTGESIELGSSAALGIVYGVLSALFYAGYLVVLRFARVRRPAASVYETILSATLGGAISTGLFAAAQGVAAPARAWPADGWLLALALGSQVVGWLLLAASIHRLPATLTSIALLLQPVLALVWGGVLLDEPIGAPQMVGAGIVLVGVALAHRAIVRGEVRGESRGTDGGV